MLRFLLVPAFVAASLSAASAQTIVVKQSENRPLLPAGAEQVRISINVNVFAPSPDDTSDQAVHAQEAARRVVYEIAGRECALLRDVLASECRLESVNVNVQRAAANQFGNQQRGEGFNVNGNISFHILQK